MKYSYRIIFKDGEKSDWFSITPIRKTIDELSKRKISWYSKQKECYFKTIELKPDKLIYL